MEAGDLTTSLDKSVGRSGTYYQEESLDSDDEEPVPRELECDTDTDGDELVIQEVTVTLRSLCGNMVHTPEFYSKLTQSLSALSIQHLDPAHPVITSCCGLVPHVVAGIGDRSTRRLACGPFLLIVRHRHCVRELLRHTFGINFLIGAIYDCDDTENERTILLSAARLLSGSRSVRNELLRCGAVEMVLAVLDDAKSTSNAKTAAVLTLRRLCKSTSAREALARLYGVAQLVDFYFSCSNHAVQKGLAGLLQTLATNADVKIQMAECGCISAFVSMLTMSQMHVLKYTICIVRNLACNNDENRVLIAQAGGIRMLLQLMPQVNIKLQQKIAGALQNLATNRDNRTEIIRCGGIGVLIALVKTPDQKLQKYGLGGLKRLVYNSRDSTLAFEKQGGLQPLISLLDSDDMSVLKNAVHALNRVRHYIGREPIEKLGGVTAMCRLLTCPHDKIRALARRNLEAMDEDISSWIRKTERVALRILIAARVLLNPHYFALLNAIVSPRGAASSSSSSSLSRSRLTLSFRKGKEMSPPPSQPQPRKEPEVWKGLTQEDAAILSTLGFGPTYWNLRPGTQHMLPIPLLQMILSRLDDECLLSDAQKREIFVWARDKSSLGRPLTEFLTSVTHCDVESPDPSNASAKKNGGCIIF